MGSRNPIAKSGKSKRKSPAKKTKRTARSKRAKAAGQPLDQVLLNASQVDTKCLPQPLTEMPEPDDLVDALALRLGRGVLLRAESIRASLSEAIGELVSVKALAMTRSKKAKTKTKTKAKAKSASQSKSKGVRKAQKKAVGAR